MHSQLVYRLALGLVVFSGLLLIWVALGVGVIGPDGYPPNMLYAGVLGALGGGAFAARLQPEGMMRTSLAAAGAQTLIAALAAVAALNGAPISAGDILGVNGMFVVLFAAAAAMFRFAARGEHLAHA